MGGGGLKDAAIAILVIGTIGHVVGSVLQYLSGGSDWLPDAHQSAAFWTAAYWFSRHPLWERR